MGRTGARALRIALAFSFLTVLMQIGGVAYLVGRWLARRGGVTRRSARLTVFLLLYASAGVATTFAAPFSGRLPLSCFGDGFPLLPHLSLDDGSKLDIAFYYRDEKGKPVNGAARSPVGYFAFEEPAPATLLPCAERDDLLTLRWNMRFLQGVFPAWMLDEARTGSALRWLALEGPEIGVERIFIEPHLAERLGVSHQNVRFQGCRAARHDDHIHFQVTE